MATTVLGEELIGPLDKIRVILDALSPVQQQQVIELLLMSHLINFDRPKDQHFVMQAILKHVEQLLHQAKGMK